MLKTSQVEDALDFCLGNFCVFGNLIGEVRVFKARFLSTVLIVIVILGKVLRNESAYKHAQHVLFEVLATDRL